MEATCNSELFKASIKTLLPLVILLLYCTPVCAQQDSSFIRRCISSPDVYEGQPVYRPVKKYVTG